MQDYSADPDTKDEENEKTDGELIKEGQAGTAVNPERIELFPSIPGKGGGKGGLKDDKKGIAGGSEQIS
jgi:hypothetical protein